MYTFLFTDIEDSTRLWEQHPQAMKDALEHHDRVTAQAVAHCKGRIFKTVGDGVFAVFTAAAQALEAALTIQTQLYEAERRANGPLLPLKVRMGLYSGDADERSGDYFGQTLNRTSRLMHAAHGGQVLVSNATRAQLPDNIELRDLGTHRLRDLADPEHIYQAVSPRFPLVVKPIRSLTPRPSNLPAQITSFVGREQAVADICRRLRQPNVRLLTLMGPGGIGKTRLSIQVGANLLDEYADGVYFISLAALRQTDALVKLLAQTLAIPDDGTTPLLDAIKAALAPRQMLLIFDNFEQILDAAPLLNELLAAAARVRMLVTSRESLYIYGEHTATVPPLNVPAAHDDISALMGSSAVSLFVERVQAIVTDFMLDPSNAVDVAEICRRLDGLPLALELAAARARDLTLHEIAEQIGQRLALLDRGPRDLPRRQQTMRGAIEWSYDLLAEDDRHAFARLAVFEGEFLTAAGQFIAGIGELAIFVNKSLLHKTGDDTYAMLSVLREYAAEKLEAYGEAEVARQKHATYYVQWLDVAQRFLNSRDQTEWFHKLHVERTNIHAALDWFLANGEYGEAGRMAGAMWRYWATQSQLTAGGQWIAQVLAHADALTPLVHARVTQGAGRLALLRHEYDVSTAYQHESLTLFRSIRDQRGEAAMLLSLGETDFIQGKLITAESYLGESLNTFRALKDQAGIGRCVNILGKIVLQHGDFRTAAGFFEESLERARGHGSQEAIALALYDMATALRGQRKYAEAEAHYRESLALYRELNLGVGIATMLYSLAMIEQAQGNLTAAWSGYLEALELLADMDEPFAIAECLIGIAGAYLLRDKPERCLKTLSAANAILTSLNAFAEISALDRAEYDRLEFEAQLDPVTRQSVWEMGQTMPLENILREIMLEPKPSAPAAVSA